MVPIASPAQLCSTNMDMTRRGAERRSKAPLDLERMRVCLTDLLWAGVFPSETLPRENISFSRSFGILWDCWRRRLTGIGGGNSMGALIHYSRHPRAKEINFRIVKSVA